MELVESGIITHHFYRQLTRYIKRLRLMENGFSSGGQSIPGSYLILVRLANQLHALTNVQ